MLFAARDFLARLHCHTFSRRTDRVADTRRQDESEDAVHQSERVRTSGRSRRTAGTSTCIAQ
jgi:hypothetical protein